MAQLDSLLQQASTIEKQYKEGLAYKKQMGYLDKWAEYERFKAGDQWPKPTAKTKNLPRPVFNIIKQIENHKVASVMNENIKMVFSANEIVDPDAPEHQAADLFSRYADTTWELIKQQELNEEALESAANTGTGIWHYYYDTSKKGGNTLKYDGQISGEVIDPVNFFPGNPQSRDVQKQPYNIITYRDLVSNVRNDAASNGVPQEMLALIQADSETQDQAYDLAKKELNEGEKVTVITKYWKENGTVFFTKVASGVVVKPKTNTNLKLYPLAVMQWERRKRSIFGIGDTEGLIPNQKAINFLIAMQLLSVQLTGWPKVIVDEAVVKQQITNTPGEVIKVNSGGTGNVGNMIQYMFPGQVANGSFNLVDSILTKTKEIGGANESALGERPPGTLNASAIMMLQKAAGVPLESIKRRFYQAMEDVGNVWADMWRVYFNTTRMIPIKDDNMDPQSVKFNGSDYAGMDLNMKVDIGPSSSYSESLMMSSLDKLFDGHYISLEQYLQFAPNNVIPFKDRLLKSIEIQQQQQAIMAQQQLQQQAQQQSEMQQQQQVMEQQQAQENAPHPFDQAMQKMPQHMQDNFKKLPPQLQNKIMNEMMAPPK